MKFIDERTYRNYFGIYGIRNKINSKVYVGQVSDSFKRRYWHHRWKLRNNSPDNKYLQNAWNKYGEGNFEYFVIEVCAKKEGLDELEIKYIDNYKDIEKCYSILGGGGGRRGVPMSEKAKRIVGDKNRINMTGKKHSKLTREKMSISRTNKAHNRHRKTTVINDEIAMLIKNDLIDGMSIKEASIKHEVSYNIVNNILSNDTWNNIHVDGWYEFIKNRNKTYRLKEEDHEAIYNMYMSGISKYELAEVYDKHVKTIEVILRKIRNK